MTLKRSLRISYTPVSLLRTRCDYIVLVYIKLEKEMLSKGYMAVSQSFGSLTASRCPIFRDYTSVRRITCE